MPTELLLSQTGKTLEGKGNRVRAKGWYGGLDGLHTVQIETHKYIGRIYIQATLARNPQEEDWFDIWLTPTAPCLEFNAPLGQGVTGIFMYNFRGNFLFVRAVYDRNNLFFRPPDQFDYELLGSINKISMTI